MNAGMKIPLHERYDWLDQARGLIVLMLIISMSTDYYAGDILMGERPVGPPMLNHGYEYFLATPAMITFIDVGQALFMFIMGFVGYTAFMSRRQKRGPLSAFWYATRRVGVLCALASLECVVLPLLTEGKASWSDFLYDSTFTMLAMGSLVGFVSIAFCPNADRRMSIGIALILLHSLLYAYPIFHHHDGNDNLFHFPFGMLGMCAVAIAGTCFGQWYLMDPEDPLVGFHKRIVRITASAAVAAYSMDWIQPAEHHDATAALQFLAITMAGITLMMFYAFGKAGFRFPLLSTLGRNLLVMFALGGVFIDRYLDLLPKSFLLQWPYLSLLLVGFVPILMLSSVAVLLDKRGIMVRA